MSYAPFGEGYAGGIWEIGFTAFSAAYTVSYNESQSGTLDDFTFRRYAPVQGRWISPDPAGLAAVDPTNPQTWNRYAYVGNNPLANADPLGLTDCPQDKTCNIYTIVDQVFDGSYLNPFPTSIYVVTGPSVTSAGGGGDGGSGVPCFYALATPCGGGAANNGFTLGIRAPGQTYSQCLAANSGTYSVNNWLPSSWQNGATKFALGNDVSGALFGDANEGTAGLLVGAGVGAAPLGVGTAGTFGRRTASIFNLNLSGTTGPAPTILGKTGAAEVVGWVSGAFELKLAADIGATAAEALNCIGHR